MEYDWSAGQVFQIYPVSAVDDIRHLPNLRVIENGYPICDHGGEDSLADNATCPQHNGYYIIWGIIGRSVQGVLGRIPRTSDGVLTSRLPSFTISFSAMSFYQQHGLFIQIGHICVDNMQQDTRAGLVDTNAKLQGLHMHRLKLEDVYNFRPKCYLIRNSDCY